MTRLALALALIAALVRSGAAFAQDTGPTETEGATSEVDSADDEGDDDSPVIPDQRPPQEIRQWFVEGELSDPPEKLREFLAPVLEGANWSERTAEDRLAPLLARLGYRGTTRTRPMVDGGVSLVITLEPITQVRYIVIDIDSTVIERLREPLFAEEVQRRMTLRPGSALERNRADREAQLRNEADRLARFLRNDGFYDAEVVIEERSAGPYASRLDVKISPGAPYQVGKITVVGNTAIAAEEIVEKFHHQRLCVPLAELCLARARFTRSRFNQDLDRVAELYQARGYPGVVVRSDYSPAHSFQRDTKTVEFTVEIRERRKIDLVFEGNNKLSDEQLKEVTTLSKEGSYDDVEVAASAEAIRAYYQTKGHFEATVTWQRVRFGVFERIIFSIDKGPQLKVRRISFSGNRAISSGSLGDLVKTSEYRRLIIGESGGYATTLQLEQDVARIRRAYVERGYLDALVNLRVARTARSDANAAALAAAVASGMDADGLYIHFDIDEGPLVVVQETRIEQVDHALLPAAPVQDRLELQQGKPFRESAVESDVRAIRSYYLQRGFPRVAVKPSWTRTGPHQMSVVFEVTEGTPARIGEIMVRGNFKTKSWVIRDELVFDDDQALTLESTDRAQSNLRRSGLFSSVKVDYLGAEDPRQERVNVLVSVEESQDVPIVFSVGGGYSSDSKAFGEAGAKFPNIGGVGADLDLQGQLGQEIQSAQGTLTLPRWIMRRAIGTALSWNLNGFWRNEFTQRFGDLESYGGSIAATKQGTHGFFEGWLLALRYDFRQRNRDEELVRPAGPSDDLSRSPVGTTVSSIGPVLVVDQRRDSEGQRNPLAPATGWRLEVRGSFAEDSLLGSNRFIKLGGSGQHFYTFGRRFRLSNAVRYDHGIPLGGDVLLPEVERFFAGGDVTVRGFEEDRLSTEVIEQGVPPAEGVTQYRTRPAGGNIRFIYNTELEVQAYRWPSVSLASAIFIDTGLVTNSLDQFQVTDLRHSVGVALVRAVSPIGALSLEWATPLDPRPPADNPRGRLHLNFGFLF